SEKATDALAWHIRADARWRRREPDEGTFRDCVTARRLSSFQARPRSLGGLVLFQRALQRMLVLPGEIHDLGHFGLGHFVGVDATHSHTPAMYVQHDASCLRAILVEKPLEDVNDEFHRGIIVV